MNAILLKVLPYVLGLALILGVLFGACHSGGTVTDDKWQAKWSARDEADTSATLKATEDARALEQSR